MCVQRKKFDDELVESSLIKSECRGRLKTPLPLTATTGATAAASGGGSVSTSEQKPAAGGVCAVADTAAPVASTASTAGPVQTEKKKVQKVGGGLRRSCVNHGL